MDDLRKQTTYERKKKGRKEIIVNGRKEGKKEV